MTLSATSNSTAAASSTAPASLASALAGGPAAADGEQRFLKLLVTQLNNQDPLNPLDNAQLTSQLAQMSTVSGIEKLNAAFSELMAQSASSQVLQSAGMVGRSVQVAGQTAPARVLGVSQGEGAIQLDLEGGRRVKLADVQLIS